MTTTEFTVFLWFVRHFKHTGNVLQPGEFEKAMELGQRMRRMSKRLEIPVPAAWYSTPQPRGIMTGLGICQGAEKMLTLTDVSPAIGDLVMGQYALNSLEVDALKAAAEQSGQPFDDFVVAGEANSELMFNRGGEALEFVDEQIQCIVPSSLQNGRISMLYTGHGGRWEPLFNRMQGKGAVPPSFIMATGTVALVVATVRGNEVKYEPAQYLESLAQVDAV